MGVADSIVVKHNEVVLRQRESTIDCATGELKQLREKLDDDDWGVTDYTYTGDGMLETVTGPPNHRDQRYGLTFSYDDVIRSHVTHVVDSHDYYSDTDYDLRFGLPTLETDINGQEVVTVYDKFGRVESITGPHEILARQGYTLRYEYHPDADVPYARTEHNDWRRAAGASITIWSFTDGLGRALQTRKNATVHRGVNSPAQDVHVISGRVAYDPWGRVTDQYHPTEHPLDSTLEFFRGGDVQPTTTEYDDRDRPLRTTLPDGTATQTDYRLDRDPSAAGAGALRATVRVLDDEGGIAESMADVRGQVRAVIEHADDGQYVTGYSYDPLGQLVRVTDAGGNVTRVAYDLAGRRLMIDNRDAGRETFRYDRSGNLIRRVTANLRAQGEEIRYTYNHAQLVGIDYPLFDDGDVTYSYGSNALRGAPGNLVGRVVSVEDATGTEERRYGPLGEMVEQTRTLASTTLPRGGGSPRTEERFATTWSYDTWGRLHQMVYPDGEVLTYTYDSGGQVASAEGNKLGESFPYVARLEYDEFGQRVFQETGNGVRTHFTYDPEMRRLSDLDAGEFQRLHYEFDDVGNITSLANEVSRPGANELGGSSSFSFRYDALYRLKHSEGRFEGGRHGVHEYAFDQEYDRIHNITHKAQHHWVNAPGGPAVDQRQTTYDWSYAYDGPQPHAPSQVGDRAFRYDRNGNQLGWDSDRSGQRRTIVWDERNHIRQIRDNGRTTEYVYDAGGQRVFKRGAQGETAYVNAYWTVRNRSVGTKHVFVGSARLVSKLSPGEAAIDPESRDPWMGMLGRWYEHRSDSGHEHGQNTTHNPHYRVDSSMPRGRLAEDNFVYFYHPDHLGSTSFVTDPDGELYEHVEYFPSGETFVSQNSNTERLPYLFTSKELDQETGLYEFGARQYDPRVGLWLSTDPALSEFLDGRGGPSLSRGRAGVYNPVHLSTFTYSNHRPLVMTDPDGRFAWLRHRIMTRRAARRAIRNSPNTRDWTRRQKRRFIRMLVRGNVFVDRDWWTDAPGGGSSKDPYNQHEHAMQDTVENTDGTDSVRLVSPEESARRANAYVQTQYSRARRLQRAGRDAAAAWHLGRSLHTVQDRSASPHGFDEPYNSDTAGFFGAALHAVRDTFGGGARRAVRDSQELIERFLARRPSPTTWFDQGRNGRH